ncbi:uncharacterized [Tachysurus ichikawai]
MIQRKRRIILIKKSRRKDDWYSEEENRNYKNEGEMMSVLGRMRRKRRIDDFELQSRDKDKKKTDVEQI